MTDSKSSGVPLRFWIVLGAGAVLLIAMAVFKPVAPVKESVTEIDRPTVPIEPVVPAAAPVVTTGKGDEKSEPTEPVEPVEPEVPEKAVDSKPSAGGGLVLKDRVFNWGRAVQGDLVVHEFSVENTSDGPLQITRVSSSSPLMTVEYDETILPGETGLVTLSLDTSTLSGRVKKTAAVRKTGPGNAVTQLTMEGMIERVFIIDPKQPRMTVVRGIENKPLIISLESNTTHSVAIEGTTSASEIIETQFQEIEPGKLWHVEVQPKLPARAKKYYQVDFVVQVAVNDNSFDIPIPVMITVKRRIAASPASVYFSRRDTEGLGQPGATPASKKVKIASSDPDHPFKITRVEVQGTEFEYEIETIEEGKEYNVVLLLRRVPRGGPGRIVEKVIVRTDDPEVREIRFNAMASVGRSAESASGGDPLPAEPSVKKGN